MDFKSCLTHIYRAVSQKTIFTLIFISGAATFENKRCNNLFYNTEHEFDMEHITLQLKRSTPWK